MHKRYQSRFYLLELSFTNLSNHLALCGRGSLCDWGSCGPAGSPGRGELHRLSTLSELLLGESSLLLQLLVEEKVEALDTTKPGERQPCSTGERNCVFTTVTHDERLYVIS